MSDAALAILCLIALIVIGRLAFKDAAKADKDEQNFDRWE